MKNFYLESSESYIKTSNLKKRKSLGQFFTPKGIQKLLWDKIPLKCKNNIKNVLEPSCGSGEFLQHVLIKKPEVKIDAVELDKELCNIVKSNIKNINIYNEDFLKKKFNKKYDLIIGNPPYFEMKLSHEEKEEFKDVINGRPNIYSLFIKKSIDLLKSNGCLAFVVPPSMNSGFYFQKLRQYIIDRCEIISIETVEKQNLFLEANQKIMLFVVVKKQSKNEKYVFQKDNILLFTPQKEYLSKCFQEGKTLKELGYEVKTGNVVWNQNKGLLSQDNTKIPLIWSNNITKNNKLNLKAVNNKGSYIDTDKYDNGPAIVVNRITGSSKNATLRAAIVKTNFIFCAENHVNVIKPINKRKVKMSIKDVHKKLLSEQTQEIIKIITGNTQISKKELENLIPLKTVS